MYRAEYRGRSLAVATFIPYLGPALGPILGGVIAQHLQWGWLFWILSMFDAVILVVGCFLLPECYTPPLLRHKAAVEHQISTSALSNTFYRDLASQLGPSLIRPLRLLVYRPAIQVIAIVMAFNFAIYCLMLSTYADLWRKQYGESPTISSLNYIAIAIGTVGASQVGGHLMDWIYRVLRDRANGQTSPEFRAPFLVPAVLLAPTGLFLYGWSAEKHLSWVAVDVGTALFTCGSFMLTQGILAYLLDEFKHAASANAAARMLSNILGFVFPIFAPQMYQRLGYGWGNSVLGFVFLVVGDPLPVVLWVYGGRLRAYGRKP
ncbi:hypothetical protein EYZ11_007089 [Aspergillus tanneri]|nr:hypothetical protein EYZ11_007089 [Aspergillus tanneri]